MSDKKKSVKNDVIKKYKKVDDNAYLKKIFPLIFFAVSLLFIKLDEFISRRRWKMGQKNRIVIVWHRFRRNSACICDLLGCIYFLQQGVIL